MKKIYAILPLIMLSFFSYGQNYLLVEYFDDSVNFPPPSWTMIDNDEDTYNWRINTWDGGTVYEIYAVSDSWLGGGIGALTPENYLISPQIDLTGLTGTVKVRYTVQVANQDYFAEQYKLSVSTTNAEVEDFNEDVFTETLTVNEYYVWKERIVDISQFIGESIYLSWIHFDCTDQYKLLLDSIQVYNDPAIGIGENMGITAQVFPNPANDRLTITGDFSDATLVLSTLDGRIVYEAVQVNKRTSIDVSAFEKGLYLLQIKTAKGLSTKKIALTN